MSEELTIIGAAEKITFLDGGIRDLPIKIDTGAYRSSIWATNIYEKDGKLHFTLLGPKSKYYSGQEVITDKYKIVRVENSFGHNQERYSVYLWVSIRGRKIKSSFTLANRSMKTYPALVGRKLLRNRFLVDVTAGEPIKDDEIQVDRSEI